MAGDRARRRGCIGDARAVGGRRGVVQTLYGIRRPAAYAATSAALHPRSHSGRRLVTPQRSATRRDERPVGDVQTPIKSYWYTVWFVSYIPNGPSPPLQSRDPRTPTIYNCGPIEHLHRLNQRTLRRRGNIAGSEIGAAASEELGPAVSSDHGGRRRRASACQGHGGAAWAGTSVSGAAAPPAGGPGGRPRRRCWRSMARSWCKL